MTDDVIRLEALTLAIKSANDMDAVSTVVDRAQKYYEFLTAKKPGGVSGEVFVSGRPLNYGG